MAGIQIPVGIKNAQFKAGLDQMRHQAKEFSHEFKAAFTGIAPAILAAFSFDKAKEQAVEIAHLSHKFAMSAEEIQRFGSAAKRVGLDMEQVAKGGFKAFIEGQKALGGDRETFEKFTKLGITMEELAHIKGPAEMILRLADAVHNAKNQHEALAGAVDLVGMRNAQLAVLLQMGRAEIEKIGDAAPVMSNAAVDAFYKMEKSINRFKKFATSVAAETLPTFVRMLETIGAAATATGRAIGAVINYQMVTANPKSTKAEKIRAAKELRGDMADINKDYGNRMEEIWNGKGEGHGHELHGELPDFEAGDREKAAEKEARAAEKIAEQKQKLEADIAKLREEASLRAMSAEERLLALQEKRKALIEQGGGIGAAASLAGGDAGYMQQGPDVRNQAVREELDLTVEQLEARKAALAVEKEIEEEQKKIADEKTRAVDAEDKAREQHAKDLAEATDAEQKQAAEAAFAKLTPAQKRAALKKQSDELYGAAAQNDANGNDVEASKQRLEAAKLLQEMDGITDPTKTGGKIASVSVDSLQAVGGGGGIGSSADPQLRKLDSIDGKLERIARAVENRAAPTPRANPK